MLSVTHCEYFGKVVGTSIPQFLFSVGKTEKTISAYLRQNHVLVLPEESMGMYSNIKDRLHKQCYYER